jgi:hypothetical protein
MKTIASIALSLCIGFALTLAGCGKDSKPNPVGPTAADPAKTPIKDDPTPPDIKKGGGGGGGGW